MEKPGILEETELIEKARSGDTKSLEEIIKKYEKTVYNFSFKICRNKDRAENTMQETFFSMVKNIGQFDGKSKLSTWLYTIVSNHCLMLARSSKKHVASSLEDEEANISLNSSSADWNIDPGDAAENNELKSILDEAIQKLPVDYRIIFLLRDVEGFSNEEAAKMANLSVAAVKSRLHRARAALRNELSKSLSETSR